MRLHSLVACVVGVTSVGSSAVPTYAAPAADVVVAWSSTPLGPLGDVLAVAARGAGAAYIDASPEATPLPDPRPLVKRGIAAYGALELDAALAALDAAVDLVDQTGATALDPTLLVDLFIFRALTQVSRGDDARAWDDLLVAATLGPTRVLDPAGFPPRIVERFEQAKAHVVAAPRARLELSGPPSCRVRLDGAISTARLVEVPLGPHWLAASCDGFLAVRRRIVVDRFTFAVPLTGAVVAPPDDAALVVQARAASAHALVTVTVRAGIAVVRRLGVDGKEQERVSLAARDAREIAGAVSRLLAPPAASPRTPWYGSRWVWAGAGALIAGAIVLPFALRGDPTAPSVSVRPTGVPPGW